MIYYKIVIIEEENIFVDRPTYG